MVTLSVLYNLIMIIGRAIFWELEYLNPTLWLTLDYLCDIIYVLDMLVHSFTGKNVYFVALLCHQGSVHQHQWRAEAMTYSWKFCHQTYFPCIKVF